MTDQQIIILLLTIKRLALMSYPYPDDAKNDSDLIFHLGEIAGIATKTVNTYERKQALKEKEHEEC